MTEENGSRPFAPERYREYLRLLAGLQLPKRLRRVLSDSDVAHETIAARTPLAISGPPDASNPH